MPWCVALEPEVGESPCDDSSGGPVTGAPMLENGRRMRPRHVWLSTPVVVVLFLLLLLPGAQLGGFALTAVSAALALAWFTLPAVALLHCTAAVAHASRGDATQPA